MLRIAADLLDRPITVIGPDAASSAEYGQDLPGDPIELIPLAVGRGFSRYLVAELPAESPSHPDDELAHADVLAAPGYPAGAGTRQLASPIAEFGRQIDAVIGPDAANSAVYGLDRPGTPIELIPLDVEGGFSSYILTEPVADGEAGAPDPLPGASGAGTVPGGPRWESGFGEVLYTAEPESDGEGLLEPAAPGRALSPSQERAVAVAERTQSGWYVPSGGAGGHQGGARDLAAALSFPLAEGAIVVHVHTDPVTGMLAAGGELLTAEEFYARVLVPLALEPGELLVMVACGVGAARAGQVEAAAGVLARLGNRRVLAASADVFTTPDGRVVTARLGFGGDGQPVVDTAGLASWTLFEPGAAEPSVFGQEDLEAPEDLGSVLAVVMQVPGMPVPAGGGHLSHAPVTLAGAVRWAMGIEIERHDVRLQWPGGKVLREKAVLLRSRDGLVQVVVDKAPTWVGADNILYRSAEAMRAAGVAPNPNAGRDGKASLPLPETVAVPWKVFEAERGRPSRAQVGARIQDVDRRWEDAPGMRDNLGHWPSLGELFSDEEYEVAAEFRNVVVIRYPWLSPDAPLFVQLTAGFPFGGGVLAALEELAGTITGRSSNSPALDAALRFGQRTALLYADAAGAEVRTPDLDLADVVTVAEVMTLAFVQISGVLRYQAKLRGFMKREMAVLPRQSLYEIRAGLGQRLQRFFAEHRDHIRELFETEFRDLFPDFAQKYNKVRRRPTEPVNLWNLDFSDENTKERISTVGRLFDEILRPAEEDPRIGQGVFDVGPADSGSGLDRSLGSGRPLVVLEMRSYGQPKYEALGRMIDYPMTEDLIGRLTGVAERGLAVAEFADRLRATEEGWAVLAAVRSAVMTQDDLVARTGDLGGGPAAIASLRQAIVSYLARFPVQRPELEQALRQLEQVLEPAARLGVSRLAEAPSGDGHRQHLDQHSDLIAAVRRNLRSLGWPGDLADDEIIRVYEQLKDDPATGRGTAAQANSVAQYIANGASPVRMRGGGSGVEAEYTYLMTISDQRDLNQLRNERAVLAYGPGRMFSVTVEQKEFFRGGDGRYYRTEDAAKSVADGTARAVTFAMPEFVSDVTRTFPGESGYHDHVPVFTALSRLEQTLADLPGAEGSRPGIPLSRVLRPEDGFELTDLGQNAIIGPRPVGDGPGAHVHHTFGVPLTGLYLFLEHVRDNTWRDESRGYLTRAHLADGLEFGGQVASRFIAEKYFPGGYLPAGFSPEDELARRTASEPAVAQLRGYAALLYTGAATVAHGSHLRRP